MHVHAKYVQGYWVREAEMMCVALLNNPGGKAGETTGQWGVARLGQLVLLVEPIGNVQNARRIKGGKCMGSFLARSDQQPFTHFY